ncbi:MAG: toll/interleukin-1 receptor domain-containing protein [Cyclobacteriaceae bacterium]
MDFKYDIALSFAGEDRHYVDKVAEILKVEGIKVFYDKFETVDLWGKDLAIHFDYVYRKSARYCIPFISASYKDKIWTRHEIKTAISRAIAENDEYILPARFDDTELDGIRPTLGYVDLRYNSPEKLAEMILEKLKREPSKPIPEKEQPAGNVYLTLKAHAVPPGKVIGFYLSVDTTNTIRENRFFHEPVFSLSKPIHGNADTFQLVNMVNRIPFPKKLEFGETMGVMYQLPFEFVTELRKLQGQDVTLTATVSTTIGEKFKSNEKKLDEIINWVEEYSR